MSSRSTRTALGLLGAAVAATAMTAAGPALAHGGQHEDTGRASAGQGTQHPSAAHASTAQPSTARTAAAGPVASRAVAAARAATVRFRTPGAALAAGYLPTDACVPGMGQHWVHPARLGDGVADPARPDILLYAPSEKGPRLVGAEWFAPDADQDLSTDADRPSMAGMPFDGPMPGHEPGMPVHYDLHLYLWEHNADGIAAPFNPRVTC